MTLRSAEARDLDAIARIQGRSSWEPAEYLDFDCRVAEKDGQVVAFLASRRIAPDEHEILFLAVDSGRRRGGIGKTLLCAELKRSPGKWFLEVRESNLPAIRLYESAGFQPIGKRENYYSDPCESAIVMRFLS